MFSCVNFCAQAFSDFGITALLKHHPEEKFCKGMLSRLGWGPAPVGTPGSLWGPWRTQFENLNSVSWASSPKII